MLSCFSETNPSFSFNLLGVKKQQLRTTAIIFNLPVTQAAANNQAPPKNELKLMPSASEGSRGPKFGKRRNLLAESTPTISKSKSSVCLDLKPDLKDIVVKTRKVVFVMTAPLVMLRCLVSFSSSCPWLNTKTHQFFMGNIIHQCAL